MITILKKEDVLFIILLCLSFFIYTFNLGLMPLLADEPTRAIVSLEMVLQNNFIYPTLGGEAYMNKPPLFNWITAFFMMHNSNYSEWDLRMLSMCFFFLMAITHYIIISKHLSKNIALWSSLAFLTCGRIIFYDSMMGYIDPLFSYIILLNFYWILFQSRQQRYLLLFSVSYVLCLIAFFLKGLPALAFQMCSLLALFTYRKKFLHLFSGSHLFGICLFIAVAGIYYYEYTAYQNIDQLISTLFDQSTQRTPLFNKIETTLLHAISFPFQFISDFLPFSLLIVFCFNKRFLSLVKTNDIISCFLLLIAANIWLYWISSETRARYLFAFLPLFFTIVVYAWQSFSTPLIEKYIRILAMMLVGIFSIGIWAFVFLPRFNFISNGIWQTYLCSILLLLTGYALYKQYIPSFLSIILLLLIIRLDFNFFILPLRQKEAPESQNKSIGTHIAALSSDKPLYLLNSAPINHDILYYATNKKRSVIQNKTTVEYENLYVSNQSDVLKYKLDTLYSFPVTHNSERLFIAKK